jgi:hypothetical protein
LVLVAVWLGGTVCAALLALFAVNLVGDRLTNPRIAPISQDEVVQEGAAGSAHAVDLATDDPAGDDGGSSGDRTSSTDVGGDQSSSREPGDDRGGESGGGPDSANVGPTTSSRHSGSADVTTRAPSNGGPSPSSAPTSTSTNQGPGGGGDGGSGSGDGGGRGPGGPSTTAPPTPPASGSSTWAMVGGTVTAACSGSTINVTSFTPAAGFSYDASGKTSGSDIDVRFRATSGSQRSEVRASCVGGVPSGSVRED